MIKFKKDQEKVLTKKEKKLKQVIDIILKAVILLICLYFFMVSLELMSSGFRLVGGRFASSPNNKIKGILGNKLAGLMAGLLLTLMVQSSSTSTSIVVSMVSAQIISVKTAVPIIMGTNIGTSITSTFVSFSQMSDSGSFERAFAGSIVHDIFNVLSVAVLMPLEYAFSYLERVTGLLVRPLLKYSNEGGSSIELLSALTKPLTSLIIQLDDSVIDGLASGNNQTTSLIKYTCEGPLMPEPCVFLFNTRNLPEWAVGIILIVLSLTGLCVSLLLLVKILNSIFFGKMASYVKKFINSDFPGVFKYFTGYVFILIGAGLTLLIQSSSVFTSTLTPLVGIGIVSIERVFPLILGSNIGTTITGILAALSSPSRTLYYALQIALCHTFFNISGIIIWYPIPFMRKVPINIAKKIGHISGKYKWFAIVYILIVFFIVPFFLLGLSFAGTVVFFSVLGPIALLILVIIAINVVQTKKPSLLPKFLQTWEFLPKCFHSLEPYDEFIRMSCFAHLAHTDQDEDLDDDAQDNEFSPLSNSTELDSSLFSKNSQLYDKEKLTQNRYLNFSS